MIRYALVVAAALASAVTAKQGTQSPTPATRRAHEFVSLMNSGTPSAIRAYAETAMAGRMRDIPVAAHIDFMMSQRDQSQGFDWVEAHEADRTHTSVVLRQRLSADMLTIEVQVEDTSPYRVTAVRGRPARSPSGTAEPPITREAELVSALERYVAKRAQADVFSGAVLLARDGKPLYAAAFGQANKDFAAPNTIATKFNLGSMNKMFTAVAIAQLVEAGKLSYDDPLAKFLPNFPSAAAARKIRIKHLLTHTSGLGSYFNAEFDKSSRARFRTVDDWMQLVQGDSVAFEPGTRWSYSNTGFLVLGKVIEVVTGQDYFTYVRDHIYKPAGMTSTDAYELDQVNPNLAVGYQKEFEDDGTVRFRNNIFMHVIRGGPAGGGYSTVEDLLRFAEALKAGKLVSQETFRLLTTPKPELESPSYGFGFGAEPGTGVVGHNGGFSGISANLDIFSGTGYVAVVLSNYGDASQPIVEEIRKLVRRRTSPGAHE